MKYIKTYEKSKDKSLIEELDLSNKELTELPDLSEYTNLEYLYCEYNNLTYLPELPKKLRRLFCNKNELISLPKLPKTLYQLYCGNNQLTSLPELPKNLIYLSCHNNKLTSLPELPNSLKVMYCEHNQLPFDDIDEYEIWYQENKHIIDKVGLKEVYELLKNIDKYNL